MLFLNGALFIAILIIISVNRCCGHNSSAKWTIAFLQSRERNMCETVKVKAEDGWILGQKTHTSTGKEFVSFQGIPYAMPPVDKLRFKPPQPIPSWNDLKIATTEGSCCPQLNHKKECKGSEDCLYLNIYTPQIPSKNSLVLKPVMFWIHGGGFTIGSGNSSHYGPEFFVEEDVVLITFNYRLGALGFLSTQDDVLPGNLGLKDQVVALRWVKNNIAAFGGDPDNVTIFGASSGGASVHYHILSPLSQGLFHKAIAQSGTALMPGGFSRFSKDRTFRMALTTDSIASNSKDLLDHLSSLPASVILKAQDLILSEEEKRRDVLFPFVACVEPSITEQETFLRDEPRKLLKQGAFSKVPFIVGVNSHEGLAFMADLMKNEAELKKIDDDFERVIPLDLSISGNTKLSKEIAMKIKNFYFGSRNLTLENLENFVHLKTDLRYTLAIDHTVRYHSRQGAPTYLYLFSYDGALNKVKKKLPENNISGATHGDEIGYLFSSNTPIERSSEEGLVSRRMVKMWTNFAKTGNPTENQDSVTGVSWPPFSDENPFYLEISADLQVKKDLLKPRVTFWNELYNSVSALSDDNKRVLCTL